MILLSLLAVLANVQDEPVAKGGLTNMAAIPVGLDGALAEFDRLCLVKPFDRASYTAAIGISTWRFRPASGGPAGALSHDSSRGFAMFNDTGRLPQCNFDTATQRPYARDAIVAPIEKMLVRKLGTLPVRRQTANTMFWQWPGETGKAVRLYLMRRPGDDPRQLSLSLQKWPAALAGSESNP